MHDSCVNRFLKILSSLQVQVSDHFQHYIALKALKCIYRGLNEKINYMDCACTQTHMCMCAHAHTHTETNISDDEVKVNELIIKTKMSISI
jgi:hypothetical protein